MDSRLLALLIFAAGSSLSVAAVLVLRRLDPPKEEGESRFEGVLPNTRGLAIFAAMLLLVVGLILALMIAPMIYLT